MIRIFLCLLVAGLWGLKSTVESAKILTIIPIGSRSHYIALEELLKELARRGHEVTVVGHYPQSKPLQNFRDILVPKSSEFDAMLQEMIDNPGNRLFIFKVMWQSANIQADVYKRVFEHPDVMRLVAEEHFDLLIFEGMVGDIFMGYAAHFKCPTIAFTSIAPLPSVLALVGNPLSQSFIPAPFLEYKEPMNFGQRLFNLLALSLGNLLSFRVERKIDQQYSLHFPQPQYPTLAEMSKNVSLVLTTSHFSQGNPRPLVPALVEVGGMQVKEIPDPLPADLQKWMDEATDGVIYMSMGTNVKSAGFSEEKLQAIIKTFAKLKQRIVWKFENTSIQGLPKNVLISKWLPQDDLLAHPNLKFFITHGGLGSIVEARVRAVPIIGIPIFADQMPNLLVTHEEGWSQIIAFSNLTEDTLTSAVQEMLTNSTYKETISRLSAIFRDRPLPPLKTAVFWVEYVLRHRGAKHMQANSVHLNFFQLHSLDVIGLLGIIALVVLSINFWILKCILKRIFGSKRLKNKYE